MATMGKLTDTVKGAVNEAIGKGKQAVGDSTHNPNLKAEGVAQEAKGEGQKVAGKVKGALGDDV